ncbi:glycosyltransferase involved in cell wall biosynthesis [Alicyclobacillus sacchari]|uniref:Glycosyltransferase involved in cell wall biosynthesis n=2 Tax=Alicyclobacillus sacchari TaxID=392010 RepID=A0A4R8LN98_9BACL|nr:glycosyltransferase [Alicyclobacillus sacchari]TDY45231.1 glycosyltransferase involved in cell wall biosynthesis [Alicyclobacillus sacchari]
MLLSACLITKDEEFTLSRCLESLTGVVDEIIVVDTGSKDKTVDIARDHGAKVYFHEWDGDFATARNAALERASGEYVLVIDADEFLDPMDKRHIRSKLLESRADGYLVGVVNYTGTSARYQTSSPVQVLRVFKNGYRYSGSIHEQVLPAVIDSGGRIETLNLRIHHLGYLYEFVVYKAKPARNMELLQRELDKDPDSLFHISNMMAEYMRVQRYDEVVKLGKHGFEVFQKNPNHATHLLARLLRMLVVALSMTGETAEAIKYAERGENIFPYLPDIRMDHAHALIQVGRVADAIPLLLQCRQLGDVKDPLIDTVPGLGSFLAAAELGRAWLLLGDTACAAEWYLTSFRENTRQENIVWFLANLLPLEHASIRAQLYNVCKQDPLCFAYFVQACAVRGGKDWQRWISEISRGPLTDTLIERLHWIEALRASEQSMDVYTKSNPCAEIQILLGLYYLEHGDIQAAQEWLVDADSRGQMILEWISDGHTEVQIADVLMELMLLHATKLLTAWLPRATDKHTVLPTILASPLRDVLVEVEWVGENGWECEFRANRAFRRGDMRESISWLEKAMQYPPSVRRVVIEADIALAHGNVELARHVVEQGGMIFSSSELLKRIASELDVRQRRVKQIDELLQWNEGDEGMNPHRAYQSSALTMPLQVKLVKLHERAVECVEQIRILNEQGEIMEARKYIQYVQDIITFLRSSTDSSTEAGKAADASYAFYYSMLVKWFLQPSLIAEQYQNMKEFWESWTETWKRL